MKSTIDGLIAYVTLDSVPNVTAYNCTVTPVGGMTFRMTIPRALDPKNTSIIANAYKAGATRHLNVVPTVVGDTTQLDCYLRDDAGALANADFVELTIHQLPLQ